MFSTAMRNAMVFIADLNSRGTHPFVKSLRPETASECGCYNLSGFDARTLKALYDRGLVSFDVRVRLTEDGKNAINDDIRFRPGERKFTVV